MYRVFQGHLLLLEVGMVTFSGYSFNIDQRSFDFKINFLFEFVSSASKLLIISRVRHVIYGKSPSILKQKFSFEFVLRGERRKRKKSSKGKKKIISRGNEKSWEERHFKKRTPWIAQDARINSIHHVVKKICYEERSIRVYLMLSQLVI